MALLLHYTGQDYISRGLLNTQLIPGSTSAIVGGCKTGKGFAFDGTVNSALFGNEIIEDTPNASFSFWFNFTGTGTKQTILSVQGSTTGISNTRLLIRRNNTNSLSVGQRIVPSQTYTYTDSPITFDTNTWHHATFILKELESKIDIYINGIYSFTHSWIGTLATSNQRFVLGKRALDNNIEFFNGQICNFKYYDHVLSAREIAEDYKSLMLHYKLDKPITDTVYDVSGFQRHITNLTTNTVTLDNKAQVYSNSLKNDGTQRLVGTSDLTDLNGLNEGSFSFRAFLTTNTLSNQYVIYNMTAEIGGNGISFIFRVGVAIAYFYGTRIEFNYTPTVDAWHHIVLVKTSTQIKVYVDNVNIYTVSATTSSKNFSNITSISSSPTGLTQISNGNVQDIRFYAKALTQAEVTELYQTRCMVDKDSNCYTYELIEGQSNVGMNKQGQLLCDEIIENEDGVFKIVKSNKTIKTKEIKEI